MAARAALYRCDASSGSVCTVPGFDRLSPNGGEGFDKLSPNGLWMKRRFLAI
jgi:hypothetical protein